MLLREFKKPMMLLVAVLAIVSIQCVSAVCTPSTCPDGPVMVRFAYSNCTGPYEFLPFEEEKACSGGRMKVVTDTELTIITVDNDQCDLTLANASYTIDGYHFGVCGRLLTKKRAAKDDSFEELMTASSLASYLDFSHDEGLSRDGTMKREDLSAYKGVIILPNVNASFSDSVPQPFFQLNHLFQNIGGLTGSIPCASINNCTLPDGSPAEFWNTFTSDNNCTADISVMYTGFRFNGTCYNGYDQRYLSYSCTDHGFKTDHYFGDSCDVSPFSYRLFRSVCSSESDSTAYCHPDLPSNPTIPTTVPLSSAQHLRLPLTVIFASFFILMLLIL